ncbi:MAG: hypothetical protein E7314_07440 [Clostridiales bacterium]|nr:hypothetical protein [Clostridiales bacterium]
MIYVKMSDNKKLLLITSVLFVASVIIRFFLADYPKAINVYPDELRYVSIAKSLLYDSEITIYGVDSDFQKILYSIFLIPAFLVKDGLIQIKLIALINSCLCSSVFIPAYLLINKFVRLDIKDRIYVMIFIFTLSEFAYSMSFMSENIYLPLLIWFFYLYVKLHENEEYLSKSIFLGILIYVVYLCKEIGLACLISVIVTEIYLCREKCSTISKSIKIIGYMLISFTICFVIAKLTVFNGFGNSYNQMSLNYYDDLNKWYFLITSFLYNSLFLTISFFVFPIIVPLLLINKLDKSSKIITVLSIVFLVIVEIVIAYTITPREDMLLEFPRQHIRYVFPVIIPLIICFLDSLKCLKLYKYSIENRMFLISIVLAIFVLSNLRGIGIGAYVDNTNLAYYEQLSSLIIKKLSVINYSFVGNSLGYLPIVLLIAICIIFFTKSILNGRKYWLNIFLSLMILINLTNSILEIRTFKNCNKIKLEEYLDTLNLKKFLEDKSENVVLFILGNRQGNDFNRIIDTYVYFNNNRLQTSIDGYALMKTKGDMNRGAVYVKWPSKEVTASNIDYIITDRIMFNHSYPVFQSNNYRVYSNFGKQKLEGNFDVFPKIGVNKIFMNDGIFLTQFDGFISKNMNTEMALLYGPYCNVDKGKYHIKIHYTYNGSNIKGSICGYADLNINGTNLSEITRQVVPTDLNYIEFDYETPFNVNNMEIRVFTKVDGLSINYIEIRRK